MKIVKMKIEQEKLDNNVLFYTLLKELNSNNRLNENEINSLLEIYYLNNSNFKTIKEKYFEFLNTIKNNNKKDVFIDIFNRLDKQFKLELFIFSIKLMQIKPLLLSESNLYNTIILQNLENLHQLSLKFDFISKNYPYYKRVAGSLLSLLFFENLENSKFNFMSEDSIEYLKSLSIKFQYLKEYGIEINQIFMIMFNESINQSIKSTAGKGYEDRVLNTLISIGLNENEIKKIHDENDKSTEYDFFFTYKNKKYGIGAKRTLRERYKQFIKTSHTTDIDVMIEITLGIDLSEEKANTIKQHNVYLFVADEIYNEYNYLQKNNFVFPVSKLNLETLAKLGNI